MPSRRVVAVVLLVSAPLLLGLAALCAVFGYRLNANAGGATGIGAIGLCAVAATGAWLCVLFAARRAGRPGWLARRSTLTLVIVIAAALTVPTLAVLAGTHSYNSQAARADAACTAADIAALEQIDPSDALSQDPEGADDGTCSRSVWVGGDVADLLTTMDREVVSHGWTRTGSGTLKAPVAYRRAGQNLVVDVARTASGASLQSDPSQGTDGSVSLPGAAN